MDERPENEHEPEDRGPEDLPRPDEILGTLFEETSLWPLLTVVLGCLGSFGAAMIVLSIVDRSLFAIAALVLVAGMTIDLSVRARRGGVNRNIAKLLGLFWLASAILAGIAFATGIV